MHLCYGGYWVLSTCIVCGAVPLAAAVKVDEYLEVGIEILCQPLQLHQVAVGSYKNRLSHRLTILRLTFTRLWTNRFLARKAEHTIASRNGLR